MRNDDSPKEYLFTILETFGGISKNMSENNQKDGEDCDNLKNDTEGCLSPDDKEN
jgi:hypothetical protein